MRNKYSKKFEDFVRNNVGKYNREDFRLLLEDKFNISLSSDALRRYLNRHKIEKYKDYRKYNARNVYACPIGTERITNEGVFLKTNAGWKRKSRVMYEKYHNCKLKDDEYIIFLNHNNNDFSKENLKKTNLQEISYLHNKKMYSKNPQVTNLGVLTAKLMIKVKERSEN